MHLSVDYYTLELGLLLLLFLFLKYKLIYTIEPMHPCNRLILEILNVQIDIYEIINMINQIVSQLL